MSFFDEAGNEYDDQGRPKLQPLSLLPTGHGQLGLIEKALGKGQDAAGVDNNWNEQGTSWLQSLGNSAKYWLPDTSEDGGMQWPAAGDAVGDLSGLIERTGKLQPDKMDGARAFGWASGLGALGRMWEKATGKSTGKAAVHANADEKSAFLASQLDDDFPFDLPSNPASDGAFDFPEAAPAIKRTDGELFDYGRHDGMPVGNPLKLPEQDYFTSRVKIKPDSDAARIEELSGNRKVQNSVNSAVSRALDGPDRNAVLNWYNTEPLRERFHDLYKGDGSPDDAYLKLMQAVGTTSPQNQVLPNIAEATHIYQMLAQGKTIPRLGKEAGLSGVAANGKAVLSRKKFGQEEGYNPKDAQKTEFFGRSLAGDDSKVVVDSHAMRGLTMSTKDPRYLAGSVRFGTEGGGYDTFSPRDLVQDGTYSIKDMLERPTYWMSAPTDSTYGLAAKPYEKAAKKFGLSPGQAQAAAWYGNADMTGVKTGPKTFNELFEQRLRENANDRSIDPEQLLSDVINGKNRLYANGDDTSALMTMLHDATGGARIPEEAIPSTSSRHMAGADKMEFDAAKAYTDKMIPDGKRDPLLDAMGLDPQPARSGQGAYMADGELQTNPLRIHDVASRDEPALTFAARAKMATGVQDSVYPHWLSEPGTGKTGSAVEAPFQASDIKSMARELGDDGGAIDGGDGTARVFNFKENAPDYPGQTHGFNSIYSNFKTDWAQPDGTGAITKQVADAFDNLSPEMRQKIDASPELREQFINQIMADEDLASTGQVGPPRQDVQNLRLELALRGFGGLRGALDEGVSLPANAAPIPPFSHSNPSDRENDNKRRGSR